MANKKKKNQKQTRTRKRKMDIDTAVVILIVAGLLTGVLIYFKSGYVGQYLSNLLGGIFGIVKYIVPIGFFAVALNMIHDDKDYVMSKLIQYGIILSCICTVLSIYEISITKNLAINESTQAVIERGFFLGTRNQGGGVIGTLISLPLIKLLGIPGTIILAIGLALIFIVFMFGFKPTEFIAGIIEDRRQRKEKYEDEDNNLNKTQPVKEIVETKRERRLREKEEKRRQAEEVNQLQINFGNDDLNLKKYKHDESDIVPLGIQKKESHEINDDPEYIEGNLFKQEEEKKQDNKKEVLQLEHAVVVEDEHYEYPPVNLLSKNTKKANKAGARALTDTAAKLQKTLYSFGVSAKVEDVSVGPAITRYELKPAEGVRVSKIANLADDIALNLAAETIRIEAPIPGKQAVRNRSAK